MKTIWKYELDPKSLKIKMPKNAKILSVGEQYGNICLWAEVDPTPVLEKKDRIFEVFGTGHKIYEDMGVERKFIGTVKFENGALMFHVYERL